MLDRKFKTDYLWTLAAQVANLCAAFVFLGTVTRLGGLTVLGQLSLLVSLTAVLGNLLSFRTNEAVLTFFKRADIDARPDQKKFAVVAGMLLDVGVASVLFAIFYFGRSAICEHLLKDPGVEGDVALYGVIIAGLVLRSTPIALLQATEHFRAVNLLTTLEPWLKLGLVLVAYLQNGRLTLHGIVVATLMANLITLLIAATLAARQHARELLVTPIYRDRAHLRQYLSYCASTFASSTLKAGNQQIDVLVLGYLTQPHVSGLYATFRQFAAPLAFISNPFASISQARFVQAAHQNQLATLADTIGRLNRRLAALFALAAPVLGLAAWVYGELTHIRYTPWQAVALPALLLAGALSASQWWARPFSSATNPRYSLISNALASALIIVGAPLLILQAGLTGAALAQLTMVAVTYVYWQWVLGKHAGRSPRTAA